MSAVESVEVLRALWPLVQHRMRQMGYRRLDFDFLSGDANCGAWLGRHSDGFTKTLANAWGEVPPVLLVRPGERANAWLARHGLAQGPVDPGRGVPYYLLIAGRPGPLDEADQAYIPLNFQHELDIFWGVGRLCFSDASGRHRLADYAAYAERVAAWEQRADAASRLRQEAAFFGTRHQGDPVTARTIDELIRPLADSVGAVRTSSGYPFRAQMLVAERALRSNLAQLMSSGQPPALLFAASHGAGFAAGDPRQVMHQGALITQDWPGSGPVSREQWLAGEDLDTLGRINVEGMIAFLFAAYGAGCPQQDEFIVDANKQRPTIAPFTFISQLPQRMLANGALAVMGHVERAWTYSPIGAEAGATRQVQPFQNMLGRLLQGRPVGDAVDEFNGAQGARSITLNEELESIKYGATPNPALLSRLWAARNDARSYVLLGDPAARLALEAGATAA